MNGRYAAGDVVQGKWTLTQLIGEGSYGKVFRAQHEDYGVVYKTAIKIITIPQNESEIKSARAEGMDDESLTNYFRSFVEEIVREFSLMSRLKGTANIVSYEDHDVQPHENGLGWDILIRMELLTPLSDYLSEKALTHKDVIKLGIDICKALELCQKFNIIHRDIKPENMFVSELGDFKLGDFGIARTVEKTTSGLSKKGTYTYMAPEVYRDTAYGSSVDIYSLGIVLYRLLNDNRAPFLPEYPSPISHSDREKALTKRIGGTPLPPPRNAEGRLAEIVLKACAYDPKDRYSSPLIMRQELEAILYNNAEAQIIYPQGDEAPIKSVEYVQEPVPQATPENHNDEMVTVGILRSQVSSEKTESVFSGHGEKAISNNAHSGDVSQPVEHTESVFKSMPTAKLDTVGQQNPLTDNGKKKLPVWIFAAAGAVVIALVLIFVIFIKDKNADGDIDNDIRQTPASETKKNNADDNENTPPATPEQFDNSIPQSIIWGNWVTEGNETDINGEMVDYSNASGNKPGQDRFRYLEIFSENMKYITISDEQYDFEVSVLPFEFRAGPSAYTNVYYRVFSECEFIECHYDKKNGIGSSYVIVSPYKIQGEKLLISEVDLDTVINNALEEVSSEYNEPVYSNMTEEDIKATAEWAEFTKIVHTAVEESAWTEYTFVMEGQNLTLSIEGISVKMLPFEWTNLGSSRWVNAFVNDPAHAYHGIENIDYSYRPSDGHLWMEINFLDGSRAIDPEIIFSKDGTLSISWEKKKHPRRVNEIEEPGNISCQYIWCGMYGGLILIDGGEYYLYQTSWEEYKGAKLLDSLETVPENLSDAQAKDLIQVQNSVLDDLQTAFKDAGVEATIDSNTGKVTMDTSILFAVDDASLSEAGKAYLNGFLDVYAAVVLSDTYTGAISEVLVEGHTDSTGTYEYNQTLSEKRADAVREYCLSRQAGLAEIMVTKGCSSDNLIFDKNGAEDKTASRRVVFKFILDTSGI